MIIDQFDRQIQSARDYIAQLRQRVIALASPEISVLQETLATLETMLIEIQAMQSELREQNHELMAAHAQVAAEQQRYRDLFEFAPDSYLVTDLAGNIHEANAAACTMLNVAPQPLKHKPLVIFMAPDARADFHRWLNHIVQHPDTIQEWEVRLHPRQSPPIDVLVRTILVHNRAGKAEWLRWSLRDITERKQAEAQIRLLNAELEQRVRERTMELENANQQKDLLLERERQARTQAEEAGQRLALLAEISRLLATLFNEPAALSQVAQLITTDLADCCVIDLAEGGSLRPVALAHHQPEMDAILRDLQQHHALDLHRPLVGRAIEHERMELVPAQATDLLVAHAASEQQLAILQRLAIESALVQPIYARGQIIGALSLFAVQPQRYGLDDQALVTDIAQRIALAIDNQQLYQEARLATNMREKFISIASHEIRSPLAAVSGNAQLLQRRVPPGAVMSQGDWQRLQIIEEQVDRCTYLLNDLLAVSTLQRGKVSLKQTTLDLAALVQEFVEKLQPTLGQRKIEVVGGDIQLLLIGDPLRIEQVLRNLLDNAIKYSPVDRPVRVELQQQGRDAVISVADEGIGIPSEALPHLFEVFYRAKNAQRQHIAGTGLGLFIVREIVALHAGTVQVSSREGEGSIFTVRLPLVVG